MISNTGVGMRRGLFGAKRKQHRAVQTCQSKCQCDLEDETPAETPDGGDDGDDDEDGTVVVRLVHVAHLPSNETASSVWADSLTR
jgi:hypothetical protein